MRDAGLSGRAQAVRGAVRIERTVSRQRAGGECDTGPVVCAVFVHLALPERRAWFRPSVLRASSVASTLHPVAAVAVRETPRGDFVPGGVSRRVTVPVRRGVPRVGVTQALGGAS